MARLACVGMATLDTLFFNADFENHPDGVTVMERYVETAGGKGLVAAAAIAASDTPCHLIALIGIESQVRHLLPSRVSGEALLPVLRRDHRVWISISARQVSSTYVGLSPIVKPWLPDFGDAVDAAIIAADVLYVAAEDVALIDYAMNLAGKRDLVTNLSLPLQLLLRNRAPLQLATIIDRSSVLLMNSGESEVALQSLGLLDWSQAPSSRLREIVVTDGPNGGSYSGRPFSEWETFRAKVPERVVCSVGAGDTFNGSFIVSRFSRGMSLRDSCEAAAILAGIKVATHSSALGVSAESVPPWGDA